MFFFWGKHSYIHCMIACWLCPLPNSHGASSQSWQPRKAPPTMPTSTMNNVLLRHRLWSFLLPVCVRAILHYLLHACTTHTFVMAVNIIDWEPTLYKTLCKYRHYEVRSPWSFSVPFVSALTYQFLKCQLGLSPLMQWEPKFSFLIFLAFVWRFLNACIVLFLLILCGLTVWTTKTLAHFLRMNLSCSIIQINEIAFNS